MIVDYYSDKPLEIVRPMTGPHFPGGGAESRRYFRDPQGFVKRWYGYVTGTAPEPKLAARRFRYTVQLRGEIYDLDTDPKSLKQKLQPTEMECKLKAMGYAGYRLGDVVAVFYAAICYQI